MRNGFSAKKLLNEMLVDNELELSNYIYYLFITKLTLWSHEAQIFAGNL